MAKHTKQLIPCINCGSLIEADSDFCYFCGLDPTVKSTDEAPLVPEAQIEEAQEYQQADFDYDVHGLNPLYDLTGVRGRRMVVYPHKVVIKTSVTLGSILTDNATDGEKTIYFKDVIGVQFKRSGLTIGYLQLETASGKGNNNASNFFDENTFTFEHEPDIREVYKYILSRLDEIKAL